MYSDRIADQHYEDIVTSLRASVHAQDVATRLTPQAGLTERIEALLDAILATVTTVKEPQLVPSGQIDALTGALTQLRAAVDDLTTEPVATSRSQRARVLNDQVAAVERQAEKLAEVLFQWRVRGTEELTAAASTFRRSLAQSVRALKRDVEENRTELKELHKEMEQAKGQSSELRVQVESDKKRLDEAISTFVDNSSTRITEQLKDADQRLDEVVSGWQTKLAEQESAAAARLDAIKQLEQQSKDVVHATTAWSVATDYGKYARNKNAAAWVCDLGAAALGAAGVGVVLYHLYRAGPDADNIVLAIARFTVSVGALGLAYLVGRRGAEHHREARAAKRTELALTRVHAFTANLSEEERLKVISDMTKRIFIDGSLDPIAEAQDIRHDRVGRKDSIDDDS